MQCDFRLGAVGAGRGLDKFRAKSGWLSRHTAWPLSEDGQEDGPARSVEAGGGLVSPQRAPFHFWDLEQDQLSGGPVLVFLIPTAQS